jgi:hypothetical protein
VFTARYGLYLCVLCGSQNKQRLFPYTARSVKKYLHDLNVIGSPYVTQLAQPVLSLIRDQLHGLEV